MSGDDHNQADETRRAPAWMSKHPCEACGTGYGMCAQGLTSGLMCCKGCAHPTRWQPDAYTADDLDEMWAGKNPPDMVLREIARLRGEVSS